MYYRIVNVVQCDGELATSLDELYTRGVYWAIEQLPDEGGVKRRLRWNTRLARVYLEIGVE